MATIPTPLPDNEGDNRWLDMVNQIFEIYFQNLG